VYCWSFQGLTFISGHSRACCWIHNSIQLLTLKYNKSFQRIILRLNSVIKQLLTVYPEITMQAFSWSFLVNIPWVVSHYLCTAKPIKFPAVSKTLITCYKLYPCLLNPSSTKVSKSYNPSWAPCVYRDSYRFSSLYYSVGNMHITFSMFCTFQNQN
jgi:hypothetical protein